MTRYRFSRPAGDEPSAEEAPRRCDHPDSGEAGIYPAPRSRDMLRSYYYFCLDHVRAYNRDWNYYAGMSEDDIERSRREDVVGWRPTWPVGARTPWFTRLAEAEIHDPFGFFPRGQEGESGHDEAEAEPEPRGAPERRAFALFGLRPPISFAAIKRRYKELVKRHHPDANGGDKAAEEKLKQINVAYAILTRLLA